MGNSEEIKSTCSKVDTYRKRQGSKNGLGCIHFCLPVNVKHIPFILEDFQDSVLIPRAGKRRHENWDKMHIRGSFLPAAYLLVH